jgi:hypothetical protein
MQGLPFVHQFLPEGLDLDQQKPEQARRKIRRIQGESGMRRLHHVRPDLSGLLYRSV